VFNVAVPTLWKGIPAGVRNTSFLEKFKPVLKTHLFRVAFTDKYCLSFKYLIGFLLYSMFEWLLLVRELY